MHFAIEARMASPLRFFGTGQPLIIDGVLIPPHCAVEVTFRIMHQRFLLRPDDTTNEIIRACFGRAYQRYPGLQLYVSNFLSNHGTLLVTPESASMLSAFMRDFKSALGRQLNDRYGGEGTVWERRYRAIPVLDTAALEDRFRYILTQGTKEDLVWNARHWPGVTSIPTLLYGRPMIGRWRDRETEYERKRQRTRKIKRAAARGRELDLPEVEPHWIEYEITHVPLPHWGSLNPRERQRRVSRILEEDARETKRRHTRAGTTPLGVAAILRTNPFARPETPKHSPAPICHASAPEAHKAFRKAARAYAHMIRLGTDALRDVAPKVGIVIAAITPPIHHSADLPSSNDFRRSALPLMGEGSASAVGPPSSITSTSIAAS